MMLARTELSRDHKTGDEDGFNGRWDEIVLGFAKFVENTKYRCTGKDWHTRATSHRAI